MIRGVRTPLDPDQVAAALRDLPGWRHERGALEKTFTFGTFRDAFSFMARVAFEAEAMNHHPDWTNVYNRVVMRLSTHDAGGAVTERDVELARRVQRISWVG
jgi:4a-hydroxytetrahydrobiopterin dehydratase